MVQEVEGGRVGKANEASIAHEQSEPWSEPASLYLRMVTGDGETKEGVWRACTLGWGYYWLHCTIEGRHVHIQLQQVRRSECEMFQLHLIC